MTTTLVAFDLGAESGRTVLGTIRGGGLTIDLKHRFANQPLCESGHLYWDLPALWAQVQAGLRRAADGLRIAAIGIDTWGVDYGLIAHDGQILGRPFHYRDARTDGVMEQVLQTVPRSWIYGRTGVQFLPINTLYQLVAELRASEDLPQRAKRLLFMPNLFNYLLSGAEHTEPTIASTSQMYDPVAGEWAWELIDRLGIPRDLLPPIAPAMTPLRDDVAQACGIAPCPVITAAGHDTSAAVVAVPGRGDGWCFISSGTWSLIGVEEPRPIMSESSLRLNFTNEVGFGGSIRFLKNIMGLWLIQECRRQFGRRGHDLSYAQLAELAEKSSTCGAVIDPNSLEFLSPADMPAQICEFCRRTSQPQPASDGQLVRCCIESLALMYRRSIEELEQLIGRRIETIHIVGGGAQNGLLNQITADICGRDVLAGPIEATAIGNLLVQAICLGIIPSVAEARDIVRRSFQPQVFLPRDPRPWESLWQRFNEVVPA